jgi:hypothetical protein
MAMRCLQHAGLTNVRAGEEQGVWEGNFGDTSPSDSMHIVFLSGPYGSNQAATSYAAGLQSIPESAVAGGRWVASAAVTGHLDFQVKAVAGCMAGTS